MKLIASLPTQVTDSKGNLDAPAWKRVTAAWEEMKRVLNAKPDSGGSTIELQTNGVDNTLQTLLNLIAGTNVTLTPDGSGGVTITAASGSTIALKTNGTLNTLQTVLNLIAGSHITLTPDGSGGVTFDVAWPVIPTVPASFTAALHKFIKSYDATTGLFTDAQPDYSDLTGTPQLAQTAAATAHKWLKSYDATTGLFTETQPDYSDLTGTPTIPPSATYSRGFSLANIQIGSDVAPHVRSGVAGTVNKVTAILRKAITTTLTMVLYLDGNSVCTINVSPSTPVDTIVAVTSFSYTTVTADSIFRMSITASDSSVDPAGVATLQVFWS